MVVGVAETVGLVASILGIANQIVVLADAAGRNKEKCDELSRRVNRIVPVVKHLEDMQWMPDPLTKSVLENLEDDLKEAKALVESCLQKRTWSRVFKTQKKANKLDAVNARISQSFEAFHMANMRLLVGLNNEQRFVMNALEMLLDDGTFRHLSQGKKKKLVSSIERLGNRDNLSADTKRMVEQIISELAYGRDGVSSSVRPGGYNEASTSLTTMDVVTLAERIMQEAAQAPTQHIYEVQQLVKAVKMAHDLMTDPQFSLLSRDPDGMLQKQLEDLRYALRYASSNLQYFMRCHPQQQKNSSRIITRAFPCIDSARSVDDDDDGSYILGLAGKITDFNHFYTYVLPLRYICRQRLGN